MIMKKFKRIYVEITNVCNLACSFCPPSGRKPEFMDEKTFTLVLDRIRGFTGHLYFHVKGEPLIHPLLGRFLDISGEKGFNVNLATNGVLIAEAKDMLLDKPALRLVSFSLHSLEERKRMSGREKYLEDIFSFAMEAAGKNGIIIEFKLWNLSGGGERELNEFIISRIENYFGVSVAEREKSASGKGIKLVDRIYLSRAEKFLWPDLNSPCGSTAGFCYGLRQQAAVLVDGTVVPCCLDGQGIMNLGNIHDRPFADIIGSDRALTIIRGFSERSAAEELCRKCTYRNRFDF